MIAATTRMGGAICPITLGATIPAAASTRTKEIVDAMSTIAAASADEAGDSFDFRA